MIFPIVTWILSGLLNPEKMRPALPPEKSVRNLSAALSRRCLYLNFFINQAKMIRSNYY